MTKQAENIEDAQPQMARQISPSEIDSWVFPDRKTRQNVGSAAVLSQRELVRECAAAQSCRSKNESRRRNFALAILEMGLFTHGYLSSPTPVNGTSSHIQINC
jgi:hypothetical protein